jgi:hypothetical protein
MVADENIHLPPLEPTTQPQGNVNNVFAFTGEADPPNLNQTRPHILILEKNHNNLNRANRPPSGSKQTNFSSIS